MDPPAGDGQAAQRHRAEAHRRASCDGQPFFVYPLQLETDFQLRAHSPYHSQKQAIDEILMSFAAHAPAETALVIKVHPLDNDLIDWEAYAMARAEALGIARRIVYLDGGDLALLLGAVAAW